MAVKLNKTAKELRSFARDLFDYVYRKHRFTSDAFEKMFTEKLILEIEQPGAKKGSKFDEHIGNSILCSQYLLREFCYYFFTRIGRDLVKSRQFFHTCIFSVIYQWIRHRNDVFLKVLDSAAIISEAVLFCDSELHVALDQDDASDMFSIFFEYEFKTEFFESGGWEKLELQAFSDYMYLMVLLQPTTHFVTLPYEKFKYTCGLISLLKSSHVKFPVKDSYTCTNCLSPLNRDVYRFSYDGSLHAKLKHVAIKKYNTPSDLLQQIKNVTTEHIESNLTTDETDVASTTDYTCRIIGKMDKEAPSEKDVEALKDQDEASGEKAVKKSSKKKKKSKSKKPKAES